MRALSTTRRSSPDPRWLAIACGALALALAAPTQAATAPSAVTTHHNDSFRTGWNANEPALSADAILKSGSTGFGLQRTVVLDAQVDAQPLVVPNLRIDGDPHAGDHDVVFVATENNTLYAIDATRGTILLQRNFGTPVNKPLGCTNNANTVGINGTPMVNLANNSLYVVDYTQQPGGPTYRIHRLALHDMSDIVPAVTIAASVPLSDGTMFPFNATYQRQRAALLVTLGQVYVTFTSFCDFAATKSRGWLFGFHAETLTPAPTNNQTGTLETVFDTQAKSTNNYFLSTIWMSGAGPASASDGFIYFVTGNSDPAGKAYDGVTDLEQSAIKFNPSTNKVAGLFTPFNVAHLDNVDSDFGSGGILLLPASVPGLPPHLAVAAGKDGNMFLMDRDNLGGFSGPAGPDRVLDRVQIGGCWCAPSYFNIGTPTIVSSGGSRVQLWRLNGGVGRALAAGPSVTIANNGQDGSAFTTISSYGWMHPIIWAVGHPLTVPGVLTLYAYKYDQFHDTLTQIVAMPAGNWSSTNADANVVPVVANGRVYVASDKALDIFGLGASQ